MKPLWQQTFKSQAAYEMARLDVMIKLTERVIAPGYAGHDFLREQIKRLQDRKSEWAKKLPVDKKRKRK